MESILMESKDIVALVWNKQVPNERKFVDFKLVICSHLQEADQNLHYKNIWDSQICFLLLCRDRLNVKFTIKSSFNLPWIWGWCTKQKQSLQSYENIPFNILFLINSQQVSCCLNLFSLSKTEQENAFCVGLTRS